MSELALIKHSRISLHASGAINLSGLRYSREPIRNLFEQEEICTFLFEKPEGYPIRSRPGPRTADINILDAYKQDAPLQAQLFIAPAGSERRVEVIGVPYQANLLFYYRGLDGLADRCLQLVVYQSTKADWPDATYFIIPSGKRIWSARLRRFFVRLTTRLKR